MTSYKYEDICVGLEHSFHVEITQQMQVTFCALTGDVNPLHCDESFAKRNGFPDRVVYGMLVSSFYSTLVGCYLPGEHCLLHSVETKLTKPVFIGDTLNVTGIVKEKNDTFNQIIVKAVIKNQNNELVSRAIIKAGVLG